MLYDEISVQDIVDSACAHEFLMEATRLASSSALEDTGRRLAAKSRLLAGLLAAERVQALDAATVRRICALVFGLRRRAPLLLEQNELPALREALAALLHGPGEPGARLQRFAETVQGPPPALRIALGSELLHYTRPERHWLWTGWLWDPETQAGALPLVLQEGTTLGGDDVAGRYAQVGAALAALNARGHAEGFAVMAPGLFGTHAFLACVYAVYMYTVFRMRLSKEFNRLLPELPELTRRILGVHKLEAA